MSGFRENELVKLKTKQGPKDYPLVGGRLRWAHEAAVKAGTPLELSSRIISCDGQSATILCQVKGASGSFSAHGTANSTRDPQLKQSLVELAETRALARVLRFAGFGVEYCSAEEMTEEPEAGKPSPERKVENKIAETIPESSGNGSEKIWMAFQKFMLKSGVPLEGVDFATNQVNKKFGVENPLALTAEQSEDLYAFLAGSVKKTLTENGWIKETKNNDGAGND